MAKKYIDYDALYLDKLLGKRSDKFRTDTVNTCLVEGRKSVLGRADNQRHTNRIEHYNKVIKALPEEKLAEYIRAFINME